MPGHEGAIVMIVGDLRAGERRGRSETQNNWNPSKWAEGPVDWSWQPESAFDPNEDTLSARRSKWQNSVIDPDWYPEDAFNRNPGNKNSLGRTAGASREPA